MMKEMLSTHLLELQDSHSMFWWVTANANRTFVCLQEKLLRASFDAVRWKMFFFIFSDWKAAKLSPSLTFFDVIFRPAFLSIRCLSGQNRLLFFRNSKLCENLSVTLNLWNHHVSAGFSLPSNQSESSDRWNVQSPRCLCADSPSSRRHYERWQGGMWFSSLQSTQSLRILYIFFFFLWPKSETIFFPIMPLCAELLWQRDVLSPTRDTTQTESLPDRKGTREFDREN